VCWFKTTATVHLAKMHEMRCVVEQSGVWVYVIKTPRPGYVVYEDEFHVVAEPFAETSRRIRA
jgi:hypothetical protein